MENEGEPKMANGLDAPHRRKLPKRRAGYNQRFKVGGQTAYLRTGEYEDGKLGEIFLDVNKQGSLLRNMFNALAMAVSTGLQYGVPLAVFVHMFKGVQFQPAGRVEGDSRVEEASSILDYVFTELELTYLKGELPPPVVEHTIAIEATGGENGVGAVSNGRAAGP